MISLYQVEQLKKLSEKINDSLTAMARDLRPDNELKGQYGRELEEKDSLLAPESYYYFRYLHVSIRLTCKISNIKNKDEPEKVYFISVKGFQPKSLKYDMDISYQKYWTPTGYYAYGRAYTFEQGLKNFRSCIHEFLTKELFDGML